MHKSGITILCILNSSSAMNKFYLFQSFHLHTFDEFTINGLTMGFFNAII